MKLKVNNNELDTVIKTVDEDTKYVRNQFDYLLGQIKELKVIWQGVDADNFCKSAEDYIKFLNTVPDIYNALCETMKTASFNYRKLDSAYANSMKKAVVKHE